MPYEDRLREVLQNPSESLSREVKGWIDPASPEGRVKIVKALFALRNRNGGDLVIGFDDTTLKPDQYPLEGEVARHFTVDAIQTILFKYASTAFEVEVHLVPFEGQTHPVISVPPGAEVPVVCKSEFSDGGRIHLRKGDLYFRTLNESGVPSSAPINARDWPALMQILYDNRDASIGRFLRRHLGGAQIERLRDISSNLVEESSIGALSKTIIDHGDIGFQTALSERPLLPQHVAKLQGLAMTVAVALSPQRESLPTRPFLTTAMSANPQYTGWPMWIDSTAFSEEADRPRVRAGVWEAFIVALDHWTADHLDYWMLDPHGGLYLHRLMQDDLNSQVKPGTSLDPMLMIYRVAEAIVVGCRIAKASGWGEDTSAGFRFRWAGLRGRRLKAWVNRIGLGIGGQAQSHDDEASSFVEVPLAVPDAALAPYIEVAVASLFSCFGGYVVPTATVENALAKLLDRSM